MATLILQVTVYTTSNECDDNDIAFAHSVSVLPIFNEKRNGVYLLAINLPTPPAASKVLPTVWRAILTIPITEFTRPVIRPVTKLIAPLNTENITSKTEATRSLMEVTIDDMIFVGNSLLCKSRVIEEKVVM